MGDARSESTGAALGMPGSYGQSFADIALPWIFVQSRTHKEQAGSLQLHAEKKALARLLVCGEDDLKVSINFNACIDCHDFFKSSSLLLDCRIQLRQPRMVHTFTRGWCSCSDRWRWESRLATKARSIPLLADCDVHAGPTR